MTRTNQISCKTPRELGYHMPAEWEPHSAIWLAWPHDPTTFPDRVEEVEQTYVEITQHIHQSECVSLFVKDQAMKQKATKLLRQADVDLGRVRFFVFGYADVWFRDYGPTFITGSRGELAMVRWGFNAWGCKYDELLKDRQIPEVMNRKMRLKCFEPGIVLEGGSIDVNGKGTLLTSEQCLLNKNRNPTMHKADIEQTLRDYVGVSHFIWLKRGISGDDTDGHVDDLARFVNPTTVVCGYEENAVDENHDALQENYKILLDATDQDGNRLNVVKLPMPCELGNEDFRLPASYTNFYIGNKTVLTPIFRQKNDAKALSILQGLFPERRVVGIDCSNLIWGFGAIHCISQQQPNAMSSQWYPEKSR
jgi:agmatine deiminase